MEFDYMKYRGKCKEACEALVKADPNLRLVRGFYYCPLWNREEQHWWCEKPDGRIIDPTTKQFPSAGMGTYREFDGMCKCAQCGKRISEEEATFQSKYPLCSHECNLKFFGLE